MIIRMEMTPPQTGLLHAGFDTMNGTLGFGGPDNTVSAPIDNINSPGTQNESTAKKKWSIFGKVLSFGSSTPTAAPTAANGRREGTGDDDLDAARRATAASTTTASKAASSPPKGERSSGESDTSSTGSTPVFDATRFVFKFTLGALPWHPGSETMGNAGGLLSTLPRDRILQRPRLPTPAQVRVSARAAANGGRTDTSPTPALTIGRPAPERMYSGASQRGLVSEARNATPLESGSESVKNEDDKVSLAPSLPPIQRVSSDGSAGTVSNPDKTVRAPASDDNDHLYIQVQRGRPENERQVVHPLQPVGIYKERATYSGRALAEWSIVVNECNSFVERRRDEGVCGLKEVEVPSLGIENHRRLG